jgi:hypothetical protein
MEVDMVKKYAWVLLFFYTIFLGALMYFCALKYAALLFELPEELVIRALGLSSVIESLSHIATVGVFGWAVWTFREQQIDKRKDDDLKRANSYSVRTINYVANKDFSLTKNTATVLISYLAVLSSEISDKNVVDDVKKEVYLAMMTVRESLKNTSLKSIIGHEYHGDYHEIIVELKKLYSDPVLLKGFDKEFYSRTHLADRHPSNYRLKPPSDAVNLHQIESLIELVFSLSEEESCEELKSSPDFFGRAHHYPALYAVYYFYENGIVWIGSDGNSEVYFDGILRPC